MNHEVDRPRYIARAERYDGHLGVYTDCYRKRPYRPIRRFIGWILFVVFVAWFIIYLVK